MENNPFNDRSRADTLQVKKHKWTTDISDIQKSLANTEMQIKTI